MTAKAATLNADNVARERSARAVFVLPGLSFALLSVLLLDEGLLLRFP